MKQKYFIKISITAVIFLSALLLWTNRISAKIADPDKNLALNFLPDVVGQSTIDNLRNSINQRINRSNNLESIERILYQLEKQRSAVYDNKLDTEFQLDRIRQNLDLSRRLDQVDADKYRLEVNNLDNEVKKRQRELGLIEKRIASLEKKRELEQKIEIENNRLAQLSVGVTQSMKATKQNNFVSSSTADAATPKPRRSAGTIPYYHNIVTFQAESDQKVIESMINIAEINAKNATSSSSSNLNIAPDVKIRLEGMPIDSSWSIRDQFEYLMFLLNNGVNSSGDLPVFPLSSANEYRANILIVGKPDKKIVAGGIGSVFVSPIFMHTLGYLTETYPEINFRSWDGTL